MNLEAEISPVKARWRSEDAVADQTLTENISWVSRMKKMAAPVYTGATVFLGINRTDQKMIRYS